MSDESVPLLLTVEQLGALLGVSAKTAYRWAAAGHLPREAILRVGTRVLFKRAVVLEWATTPTPVRPKTAGRMRA